MPITLESSSSMRYNHVMRRTSRWLCTTLRVPTSAQGNTRAVNEFPVPPVFFLVLQCGLIFFTLISLVPWQNWAILSYSVDPWKKPRAEIWNAKQIMRFLSSLPFFSKFCLHEQCPMQHVSKLPNLCCQVRLDLFEDAMQQIHKWAVAPLLTCESVALLSIYICSHPVPNLPFAH